MSVIVPANSIAFTDPISPTSISPRLVRTLSTQHWVTALDDMKENRENNIRSGKQGDWTFYIEKDIESGKYFRITYFKDEEMCREEVL
jgi:hypothetical protein